MRSGIGDGYKESKLTATQQQKPSALERQIDEMVRAGTEALPLHDLTPDEIAIAYDS